MIHFLAHFLGLDTQAGSGYTFWSGFGADISEFAIIGAAGAMYRKHNCHEVRCWRLGHHPVPGTPFRACRKHHPDLPRKPERGEISRAWAAAKGIPVRRR